MRSVPVLPSSLGRHAAYPGVNLFQFPAVGGKSSGQLQGADGKGGHGNHGDRVEHRWTHQLRVVGHHLGAHGRLFADDSGRLLNGRGSVHLRVGVGQAVVEGVRDVADHSRLWDSHRLGVERGQVLAEVGHRVHGDVADGLVSGGQLDSGGAGGGGGGGGSQVGDAFGRPPLDDVIDRLDDRGVGHGSVRDHRGVDAGHGRRLGGGGQRGLSAGDGCSRECRGRCGFGCRLNVRRGVQVGLSRGGSG